MEGICEISTKEFNEKMSGNKASIVHFFAEWNMNCLMMDPILEDLADKFGEHFDISKMNIDENAEILKKLNVSSVPTLIVFKEGKEACRMCGSLTSEQIEEKLENFLK